LKRAMLQALATALLLGALACSPGARPASPASAPAQAAPSPVSLAPEIQSAVDAALKDAAGRSGIVPAQYRVEVAEPHEWSDSSLGCAEPGMMYAQVITPGYRLVLTDGTRRLEYHADRRGRIVYCGDAR
jgi:hypothetical protein